jgi:hypothetical protein
VTGRNLRHSRKPWLEVARPRHVLRTPRDLVEKTTRGGNSGAPGPPRVFGYAPADRVEDAARFSPRVESSKPLRLHATREPEPGCSAGSDFAARRATLEPLPKQDSGVPEAMATKGTEELPQFHENAGPQSSANELSPDTVCRAPPNGVVLQGVCVSRRSMGRRSKRLQRGLYTGRQRQPSVLVSPRRPTRVKRPPARVLREEKPGVPCPMLGPAIRVREGLAEPLRG